MAYVKTEWEAAPSTNTPINPTNLNHIEQGIYDNSLGVENIGNLSNLETTAKTTIVAAINELKENLGGKLLWTNSNPSSNFNSQDINLSSNDYDMLTIIYKTSAGESLCLSETIIKGQNAVLHYVQGQTTGYVGNIRWRNLTYVNSSKYTASAGYNQVITQSTSSTANQNIIPLYIIGYKTGLFN